MNHTVIQPNNLSNSTLSVTAFLEDLTHSYNDSDIIMGFLWEYVFKCDQIHMYSNIIFQHEKVYTFKIFGIDKFKML